VLQADGGTRTAAITGGYVALALALTRLHNEGMLPEMPLHGAVAAISVGIVGGEALLDLDYSEDSQADVDCNIVQTSSGHYIEVQSTAEGTPCSRNQLDTLLDLAHQGIADLLVFQQTALASASAPNASA
jgi:ribonuclease PH